MHRTNQTIGTQQRYRFWKLSVYLVADFAPINRSIHRERGGGAEREKEQDKDSGRERESEKKREWNHFKINNIKESMGK